MIQVENLTIIYHGVPLFEEATFSIQPGERCGLIGRNGSGKSTLFKLLSGEEIQDAGTISIGKNYRIGTLKQQIAFSRPVLIEEAALGLRSEDQDNLYQAEKILFGLGFKEEDLYRSPQEFSGGYQLRLHLAKLLIGEPDCLLLDEPTNYLDILSIRWLGRFLKQWKGEFILVSHDREFMDEATTHTMGIHRQKVRKVKGGTVAFFEKILQEEEVHERTRVKLEKKKVHAQSFIDRFGAKATKAAQAQSRQKLLQRIPILEKLKDIYHLDFHFNEAPFAGKKMVEAEKLCFSYHSEPPPLIENFSISFEKGERIAVIGKNGRGKSTILRLLAGDLAPDAGIIKRADNIRLGYFGQTNINRLHPSHTITEEIASANTALNLTEVKAICGLMMFSGDQSKKTTSFLSGGEKSRVLLGKILATPCNLLLLDEPTHHLDMESIEALIDALEDFQGTVVLVTHSELMLKRMALDKIVICRQAGQELFLGEYPEFLEKSGWHDESETEKPKKKSSDLKEKKLRRADLIIARSKELKPLDDAISKLEKIITNLEVEQHKAHHQLLETSERESIQELTKAIGLRAKFLEEEYEKLTELSKKREERCQYLSRDIDAGV